MTKRTCFFCYRDFKIGGAREREGATSLDICLQCIKKRGIKLVSKRTKQLAVKRLKAVVSGNFLKAGYA